MQMDALDRFLEKLLETDLSLGTLHLVLSRLKESGRLDLVIQQGRKALNAHPDHVGLRMLLAEAYMENGLGARACEEMERAALRLDEMADAYRRLAEMYLLQGRKSEAARCLSIYLAHREDDDEARETLTRILPQSPEEPLPEESQPEEAAEEFEEEAEQEDAVSDIATSTLAELYVSQGQIQAAVETYKKILEKDPADEASKNRLQELEGLNREATVEAVPAEEAMVDASAEAEKRTLEKMIAILEQWLSRIQEK